MILEFEVQLGSWQKVLYCVVMVFIVLYFIVLFCLLFIYLFIYLFVCLFVYLFIIKKAKNLIKLKSKLF